MICKDGKAALYSFALSSLLFISLFTFDALYHILFRYTISAPYVFVFSYLVFINLVCRLYFKGHDYQIAVRALNLGCVFAIGVYIKVLAPQLYSIFGVYMCVMSAFHFSEYLTIAIIHPSLVTVDSFVINHSPQYTIAAISSWFEFALEAYFFPGIKTFCFLSSIGLILCVGGEIIRKAAMLTAQSNFNHLVQCEKSDDHVLVTHGIYSWSRHPSYVGWFYWSIGTQLVLLNPICTVGYALASWFFFNERITIEEITLLNFFGQQYCDYQQKVGTGLPFINGYKIKL